jgi:four helix bundle protein
MHNFKELKAWQQSRAFIKDVYELTAPFPQEEKFGLTAQLRRAVVSIASNIAEGSGRNSDKDFAQFLNISLGSAYEVESLLYVACDLGFLNENEIKKRLISLSEIQRMIFGLIKTFRQKS